VLATLGAYWLLPSPFPWPRPFLWWCWPGRTTWLVVTRRRDEEAFQAWLRSPAFGRGHRSAAERAGGPAQPPVGISSELWSYEVAGGSSG